jgi:MFS family permease
VTASGRIRVRLGGGFHLLFAASAVSAVGDGIGLTALPLLAAQLSRDPLPVSLVSSAGHLPWLVFGLVAGAITDRHDRRRLMWGTDVFRAVLVAALAAVVLTGTVTIWVLVIFAFLLGSAGTLFDSAAQALIPAVVPAAEEPLQRANGRLYGAQLVGDQLVGPPAGGALFTAAAAVPFALDALSFAGSAALIAAIRGRFQPDRPDRTTTGGPTLWRDIAEGVRWLARHRLLRTLALLVATINAALAAGQAVLVLLATGRLHLTSLGFGLLLTGGALGGIAASLTAARIATRLGTAATLLCGLVLSALGTLGIGLAPTGWACATAFAITAYAAMLFNIAGVPLRQMLIPDALRGRVISAYRVLAWGAAPVGGVLGGAAAAWLGIQAPFLLGAAVLAGCALVAWRQVTADAIEAARSATLTAPREHEDQLG